MANPTQMFGFRTASGKDIVVSQKALEEAERKMKTTEPEEASLALSQTFLPQSIGRLSKAGPAEIVHQPGSSSASFQSWNPDDSVNFTVKNIYPPAHQLADRKYLVSDRAFKEMKRTDLLKIEGMFGSTAQSNAWTVNRQEMEQMSSVKNQGKGLVETGQMFKVTGTNELGAVVRVLVSSEHGRIQFVAGKSYILCGFEKNVRGDVLELKSTSNISVIPCSGTAAEFSHDPPLKIRQILEKANSISTPIETTLVGKVVTVHPYTQGAGQTVFVKDGNDDFIKIKFNYTVEVEGVKSIVNPGNVLAFVGLTIHHCVTKFQGYLFANEYTDYFTAESMPAYLKDEFDKLACAQYDKIELTDCLPNVRKRDPDTTTDGDSAGKKIRYK